MSRYMVQLTHPQQPRIEQTKECVHVSTIKWYCREQPEAATSILPFCLKLTVWSLEAFSLVLVGP